MTIDQFYQQQRDFAWIELKDSKFLQPVLSLSHTHTSLFLICVFGFIILYRFLMTVQAKHNQWLIDYSSPEVMCPIFWRDFPMFASDWLWRQSLNVFAWMWSLDVSLSSGVDLLNVNTVKLIHILVSCISKYALTCTLKQGYGHAISDGGKRELKPKKILIIWNCNQC